jgi:hypothetical protein
LSIAKKKEETTPNPRAEKNQEKVKFERTLVDMIKITVKPTHNKLKGNKKQYSTS